MSHSPARPSETSTFLSVGEWTGIAFVYWVAFMGVLTPGNLQGVAEPDWGREALRLTAAGALGASVTPVLLALVGRFPLDGPAMWRNASLQAAAVLCLAPSLVVASCFLAAWVLAGRLAPTVAETTAQLSVNGLLLIFCLALLLAAINVAPRIMGNTQNRGHDWLERFTISERGRLTIVALSDVEWIETQGNYQALHTANGVHLLRETSARLATRLDPSRFVRIHRRYLVAVDKVQKVEPLPNGDATVTLRSGAELRQSRQHRAALRELLQA